MGIKKIVGDTRDALKDLVREAQGSNFKKLRLGTRCDIGKPKGGTSSSEPPVGPWWDDQQGTLFLTPKGLIEEVVPVRCYHGGEIEVWENCQVEAKPVSDLIMAIINYDLNLEKLRIALSMI